MLSPCASFFFRRHLWRRGKEKEVGTPQTPPGAAAPGPCLEKLSHRVLFSQNIMPRKRGAVKRNLSLALLEHLGYDTGIFSVRK